MAVNGEPVGLRDLFLELFDIHIFKLDDLLTLGTDQVVMVVHVVGQLVPGVPVPELPLFRQAAFAEKIECPIDRRQSDRGVLLPHDAIKLFGRHVTLRLDKRAQNGAPLFGDL